MQESGIATPNAITSLSMPTKQIKPAPLAQKSIVPVPKVPNMAEVVQRPSLQKLEQEVSKPPVKMTAHSKIGVKTPQVPVAPQTQLPGTPQNTQNIPSVPQDFVPHIPGETFMRRYNAMASIRFTYPKAPRNVFN